MQEEYTPKTSEESEMEVEDYDINLNRKISELSELNLRYTYSNASNNSQFSLCGETSTVQFEPKFVKDEELYSSIVDELTQVKLVVNFDNDDICLYLYHYFQWNHEKMTQNVYSEEWGLFKQCAVKFDPCGGMEEKQIQMCGVCLEETQLYSSGMCQHRYCRECWNGFIRSELQAGKIFFGCMNEKQCEKAPVLASFVNTIAPDQCQLYRRKVLVNYAIQNKDICYCPNEKCPYFCSKENMHELNLVKCPCGQLYCFRCVQEPHEPAKCKDVQKWKQLINSQQINSSWISNNTRKCPKCHQPIEKKVGCSHMKCICGCQFCYECNKGWDEAHREKKQECPYRKDLGEREKLSDQVVELDEELSVMMREADKHQSELRLCETVVKEKDKEESLLGKVISVKVEVMCAWMTIKWAKIVLTLEGCSQIYNSLQEDYVQSIRGTMQLVEYIIRNHNTMATRDLQFYGEKVLSQKEEIKKNRITWLQAFEANISNNTTWYY